MLCSVEDVAFEGAFELNSLLEEKIAYKIQNLSLYIHQISSKDLSRKRYCFYARMACVYGVLMWLEGKKLVQPSSMISVQEGNISITYKGSDDSSQPPGYKESYDYYMGFLLPYPPVGVQ